MSDFLFVKSKEIQLPNGDISRSFETYADFSVFGDDFINNVVKIDTGCGLSTFPYYRLTGDTKLCREQKRKDIQNAVAYTYSYGVETGGRLHLPSITNRAKLKNKAIKFKHSLDYLEIAGYDIGSRDVYINYDRRGNILIGMDILSEFETFMGESLIDDSYVMISCLKDKHDKHCFYDMVKKHFGVVKEPLSF